MTREERNTKLKAFITCLKCELSGKCCDDNCSTQYDAGNMGEIIENLEAISKVLEQEPVIDKARAEIENTMKYQYAVGENEYAEGFEKSLEIIDKYKAESEVDNENDN